MASDVLMWLVTLVIALLYGTTTVSAIGCFVCTSINLSEPECEDLFNNTGRFYNRECMAPRAQHSGFFPATHCVKFKGEMVNNGDQYVVRACVVDDGGVNSETELARSNHCGLVNSMIFNDEYMNGCVMACDTDGCNSARAQEVTLSSVFTGVIAAILLDYIVK